MKAAAAKPLKISTCTRSSPMPHRISLRFELPWKNQAIIPISA
jgi:hypothetical protein